MLPLLPSNCSSLKFLKLFLIFYYFHFFLPSHYLFFLYFIYPLLVFRFLSFLPLSCRILFILLFSCSSLLFIFLSYLLSISLFTFHFFSLFFYESSTSAPQTQLQGENEAAKRVSRVSVITTPPWLRCRPCNDLVTGTGGAAGASALPFNTTSSIK